jgi:hypothetical protein
MEISPHKMPDDQITSLDSEVNEYMEQAAA